MKRMVVAAVAAAVMGVGALMGTLGAGEASAACLGSGRDDVTRAACAPGGGSGSVSPESTRDQQRVWPVKYTTIDADGVEHEHTRWTSNNPND